MWQRWQGYYLCILWRTLLNNKCVLVVYKNVCLKKSEVWQNFFLTQLQSRLSHKVCRLLFSAVLLCKFTIIGFPLQRVSQVWHTKLNPCGGEKFLLLFNLYLFGLSRFCWKFDLQQIDDRSLGLQPLFSIIAVKLSANSKLIHLHNLKLIIFSSFNLMKTTVQEVESLCQLTWFIVKAFIIVRGPLLYRRRNQLNVQAKCKLTRLHYNMTNVYAKCRM